LALLYWYKIQKAADWLPVLHASNQVMGVRKTTDFLEKLTWGFAISMLVLAMIGNFVLPRNTSTGNASVIEEQIQNTPVPSPVCTTAPGGAQPAPAGGQAQPAAPAPAQ
jgi:preprotein translocase subunit SecG